MAPERRAAQYLRMGCRAQAQLPLRGGQARPAAALDGRQGSAHSVRVTSRMARSPCLARNLSRTARKSLRGR